MMARGNDGNLFQHIVEIEAADCLVQPAGRLHLVATHAMDDGEPLGDGGTFAFGEAGTLLRSRLLVAQQPGGGSLIVRAYRGVGATTHDYPNTARLLRWFCAERGCSLTGTLVEAKIKKAQSLVAAWSGTAVEVLPGPWQDNVARILPPPAPCSWIFTMDPMSFVPEAGPSDDKMSPSSLDRVRAALDGFLQTGWPGVFALFVYSLMPNAQRFFVSEMMKFAVSIGGAEPDFLAIPQQKSNSPKRHVVALISSSRSIASGIKKAIVDGRQLPLVEPYRS